jgi:hypothetical protein
MNIFLLCHHNFPVMFRFLRTRQPRYLELHINYQLRAHALYFPLSLHSFSTLSFPNPHLPYPAPHLPPELAPSPPQSLRRCPNPSSAPSAAGISSPRPLSFSARPGGMVVELWTAAELQRPASSRQPRARRRLEQLRPGARGSACGRQRHRLGEPRRRIRLIFPDEICSARVGARRSAGRATAAARG